MKARPPWSRSGEANRRGAAGTSAWRWAVSSASWPNASIRRTASAGSEPNSSSTRPPPPALLLPRTNPGKRAPLWLQRLRGRDLLQVARRHPDLPIVAETFRECLHDHLDLTPLQQLLADVRSGQVQVVARRAEAPSPFA